MLATLPDVVFTAAPAVSPERVLNLVLLGQMRAGLEVLRTALCCHPSVHCHGELLHTSDKVRRRCHELYFGKVSGSDRLPDFCAQVVPRGRSPLEGRSNPERYLTSVLKRPLRGEKVLGLKLTYPQVLSNDLWDFMENRARTRPGALCAIHVYRNPLVCLTSWKQAQQSRLWRLSEGNASAPRRRVAVPVPVRLELDEVVAYVRQHEAAARKTRQYNPDLLDLQYSDLLYYPRQTLQRVWRYLEVADCLAARPSQLRLPNRSMRARVSNWDALERAVPSDVRPSFHEHLH